MLTEDVGFSASANTHGVPQFSAPDTGDFRTISALPNPEFRT
jgi:hypothetical protein